MSDTEACPEFLPLYEEVAKCGKCGFCQPTCPVYTATGLEAHVARGKNALFRNIIEGQTEMGPDLREAFENCLLCRACTANCFPAVKTDKLVVAFREAYGHRIGRPSIQRLIFRRLLPYPDRMARLLRIAWTARRLRLDKVAKRLGLLRMINPKLEKAMELREEVPSSFLRDRLRTAELTAIEPRFTVGYWISCGYNYMLPEIGEATVEVLRRNGARVTVLPNNCCGLPVHGYGDVEGARLLAMSNIDRLGDLSAYDYIVSECGSCAGNLKEYPQLLADNADYVERARLLSSKTRSFSEFLCEVGPVAPTGHLSGSVTFHDSCHLGARYQGVVAQPRNLIRGIPGLELRELPEADWCCGSAGSYNVMHNSISMKILDRKMTNVARTEADVLAAECPSCLMQLALGVKRKGLATRVMGISELLRDSYCAADQVQETRKCKR